MLRPLNTIAALALASALAALTPPCSAAQIYRWTDAHGTVHFSDAPPPHGIAFKLIQTGADKPQHAALDGAVAATTTTSSTPRPAKTGANAEAPASRADTPENRSKLCEQLENNIALLSSDQALTLSTAGSAGAPPGKLSSDRRSQELATARGQYQQYCSK